MNITRTVYVLWVLGMQVSAQTDHTIHFRSAPVPGATLEMGVRYPHADAGQLLYLLASRATLATVDLGLYYVHGSLRVDLPSLMVYPVGILGNSGVRLFGIGIPNTPAVLGAALSFQSAAVGGGSPVVTLSQNAIIATVVTSIGSVHAWSGTSPSRVTGDYSAAEVTGTNMGSPSPAASPWGAFQVVRHKGARGFVEGVPATFAATPGASDLAVLRRDRVARNARSAAVQTMTLPGQRDLAVVRSMLDCREYLLATIDQLDGTVHELTGSRREDASLSCPPTTEYSAYRPAWAFNRAGTVAAVIWRSRDHGDCPEVGAADQVLLALTDPAASWSGGQQVLDVTPTAPGVVHSFHEESLRIIGDTVFVDAVGPACDGGVRLFSAPIDGSAPLAPVSLPNTGTGLAPTASYGEWRIADTDRAMAVRMGAAELTSGSVHNDVLAVTRAIGAPSWSLRNVTLFPIATAIDAFGLHTVGDDGITASLSPDGTKIAFRARQGTSPRHGLYVAPLDGSRAGLLENLIGGAVFDAQVAFVGYVHFAANDRVLFLAGRSAAECDWYALRPSTGVVTRVTSTATGSLVQPFTAGGTTGNIACRGTFTSDNGLWLYFVRGWGGTQPFPPPLRNNIVGINVTTLALVNVTGSDFGTGGTAPAIYRGPSNTTLTMGDRPAPGLELQLRRIPNSGAACFVGELAAGATGTVFGDCNLFWFDIEGGGVARQLTNYTRSGALDGATLITQVTASDDGVYVAWAQRAASSTASEDVFVARVDGATPPRQLSASRSAQTITDGSIAFTGSQFRGVAWSSGTGSVTVPFTNVVASWSSVDGMFTPLLLTEPPSPQPARTVVILGGGQ